jgi:hypothetical protein
MAMDERIDRDRLSVLSGAVLLALALSRLLELPAQRIATINLFGSPLGLSLTDDVVMALVVMGLAITAADALVRSHPQARRGDLPYTFMFWIVPGLLGLGLAVWLNQIADLGQWTLLILVSSVPFPILLSAEYAAVDDAQRRGTWLQWLHAVLLHLTALLIFFLVYNAGLRTLIGAPLVAGIAGLLGWRLFWPHVATRLDALSYGVVCGLLLGQMLWVLNYWALSGLRGGLMLLLLFYVVVGLIQQTLGGRFDRRLLLEYGGLTALALLAIFQLVN